MDPSTLYLCAFYTQFFYNGAYLLEKNNPIPRNARSQWYLRNRKQIMYYQVCLGLVLAFVTLRYYLPILINVSIPEALLLIALIILALSYYGIRINQKRISLRNLGWNKPFVIGLLWTAMCVWFPELVTNLKHKRDYDYDTIFWLVAFNNFVFISLLAIIFDVKDYADDKNEQINTFIVRYGLEGATKRIIYPISLVGMVCVFLISWQLHLMPLAYVYQLIPYIGIIILTQFLRKQRTIYYYLLLVDGLIILKGGIGVLALQE